MKNIKALLPALAVSTLLVSCGGGSSGDQTGKHSSTPKIIALDKIADYADDNKNPIPTVADYETAGVSGVDSTNIESINEVVDALVGDEVDSASEIEEVIAELIADTNEEDTIKPVITLIGSDVSLIQGTEYTDAGATATDDKDGNITANININNPVDTTTAGVYIITYNVKDASDNNAVQVTRRVIVTEAISHILTGGEFSYLVDGAEDATFSVTNAPEGFSIQAKTGIIHWTPTERQVGSFAIEVVSSLSAIPQILKIEVEEGLSDPQGVYLSLEGDDETGDGTSRFPYKTLRTAVKNVSAGDTIYIRGGVYHYIASEHKNAPGSIARITKVSGTKEAPITIRPYGNEYVKFTTDVTGIQFVGVSHWKIYGLEIEGYAKSITLEDAMSKWWAEGEDNKVYTAKGIVALGGGKDITKPPSKITEHILIENNVVHDFPGGAIVNNGTDFITIKNNIVYNSGWWSISGVHGVSNSYLRSQDNENTNDLTKFTMDGNLVFANQSRIISHVFSKGFVHLGIDEGNGLHIQNNERTYKGRASVKNNLMLFNGKGGFGINTMDHVTIENNSFYQNAQVVDTSEFTIQTSDDLLVTHNLFSPLPERGTIKLYGPNRDNENGVWSNNLSTPGNDYTEENIISKVAFKESVFQSPNDFNFSPTAGVATNMGVPEAHLERMRNKVKAYGIKVQKPNQVVIDDNYLDTMVRRILNDWPSNMAHLILEDGLTKNDYHYNERCSYPNEPAVVGDCL